MMVRGAVIKREGSKVYVLTDKNEIWLTKRVKQKKNQSRQRKLFNTILYIPVKLIMDDVKLEVRHTYRVNLKF